MSFCGILKFIFTGLKMLAEFSIHSLFYFIFICWSAFLSITKDSQSTKKIVLVNSL